MKIKPTRINGNQDGITLLITLLLMGVLLGVSSSLLNVTLKQFQLSGIAVVSEVAFQAASAGMECAVYQDQVNNKFNQVVTGTTARTSIPCFDKPSASDLNSGNVTSGSEQRFRFSWGSPEICTEMSIYKFYNATNPVPVTVNGVNMRPSGDCPAGSVCTVVQSRGYNVTCASIAGGGRVVEREYTQVY